MKLRIVFILTALGAVQCNLINSCDCIKSFINGHNNRRLLLAKGLVPRHPAASKMTYVIWDEELARKASKWAANNNYQHNPDKTISSGRFNVGENIYKYETTDMTFTDFDPEMAMDYWWNEYKDWTYRELSISDFSGSKEVGHYTQMAWADTIKLGCGISQYHENNLNNFFVVCNYGPNGNILGQAPYESSNKPGARLVCGESDCSNKYGSKC